ncbi:MAG: ABC transporter ATP-binding protein [Planctomycetota bacterium]|nr:ABC transporter ATP-binding protein [Planctomycetota bacterium]MDA0918840.1 ABC transporter ATP-binding protein [Planctomycetota bacterium]MDA1158633.1 ABC transporter ATP-binding protein [Planctomycetota bacterium]
MTELQEAATRSADISLIGLSKDFTGAAGQLSILRNVDLSLSRGDALAVTGPSGSGKSTLLYIVGMLDELTAGNIEVLGSDPTGMSESELAKFRNEHIGFIFQDHHLLPQCTVLENVLIPLLAGNGVADADEQRARELLTRVGLADRVTHRPAQLSGGERQRVAVCRALINQPEILLADEPTGNLDHATADAVGDLLLELSREQNVLLICVTHSTELANRFPQHMELRDGRLEPAS